MSRITFSCSFETCIMKISDDVNPSVKSICACRLYTECNVQVHLCASGHSEWDGPVFAHSCICMLRLCLCEQERRRTGACQPVTHGSAATTFAACCERPCRLAAEGRPSLRLTQAKRGFLRVFCHTIWALVPVTAPLRTHLAAHGADGHLLFATSWWREKNNMQQTQLTCSLPCVYTVTRCQCDLGQHQHLGWTVV